MKVLIVDDSGMIRMILTGLLKQLNITDIREAPNGKLALDAMENSPVNAVLMDLNMPEMDGLTCLAEMRKRPTLAALPVIIISSDTDPALFDKARALGVKDQIKKPFRLEGLKEALIKAGLL